MASEWSLSFKCYNQNTVCISHLSDACYIPGPIHLTDFITPVIFGEVFKLWSSSLCSLLQTPATSSTLGPNILLSTLTPCSSLSVTDLPVSYLRHSKRTPQIPRPCVMLFFTLSSQTLAQPSNWKTTPIRLLTTAYLIRLQLSSKSGGRLLHPEPEDTPCRGGS
jgi:hypothetical protein